MVAIMYYTDYGIYFYQGDIQVGDREATTEEVAAYELLQSTKELASQTKRAKEGALDRITVTTTAGNTFDGRDKDQLRMLAALQSSQFLGLFNTPWKLSDNSVVQVSVEELREALALSIQEIGKIIVGGAS